MPNPKAQPAAEERKVATRPRLPQREGKLARTKYPGRHGMGKAAVASGDADYDWPVQASALSATHQIQQSENKHFGHSADQAKGLLSVFAKAASTTGMGAQSCLSDIASAMNILTWDYLDTAIGTPCHSYRGHEGDYIRLLLGRPR